MSANKNCDPSYKGSLLEQKHPGQDGLVILAGLIARKQLGQKIISGDGHPRKGTNAYEHDNTNQGEVH
jgi:hypothetical protein